MCAASWEAAQTADARAIGCATGASRRESLQRCEQEFDGAVADPDAAVVRMIIEADGRAVGDIDLFHIDQRNRNALIGVGIWRAEDRDKGYGGGRAAGDGRAGRSST